MDIIYFKKFEKQFKKLSLEIKLLALEKERIFKIDPFDSRLKTHKLHGKFSVYLAFSVNYKYRSVFSYADNKKDVRFHDIGTHDIYE
jgi:mRNA-degrading endonuclease YafQ of YafQ-DinJ toxin-antitoxin module